MAAALLLLARPGAVPAGHGIMLLVLGGVVTLTGRRPSEAALGPRAPIREARR